MDKKKAASAFVPTGATLFFLIIASMMNCMGGAAVAPTLPLISEVFPETSETVISMIVTLPSLGVAVSGFFIGALADRFGKVRTLVVSLIILMVTGTAGTYLPTVETILVSRFLLGIGIAGISLSSSALISEYYSGQKRNKVYGWQSFGAGLGVLVLETAGGYMALLGWRIPFLIYLVAIVILIGAAVSMREPVHEEYSGTSAGGDSLWTQDPAAARKRLLTVTIFCSAVVFCSQICFFSVPAKMPYLLTEMGASTAVSGWFLGFHGIALAVFSLLSNRIMIRIGRIPTLVVGMVLSLAGLCSMAFSTGPVLVLVGAILIGAASGVVMPVLASWLGAVTSFRNSGKVMGTYTMVFNVGQFCSTLVSGLVLGFNPSYHVMYFVLALIAAAVIITAIILARPMRRYATIESVARREVREPDGGARG